MVELEHLPHKEKASGAASSPVPVLYLKIIKETEPRLFSGAG